MDVWYSEHHTDKARFSIKINRQLACVQSDYQRIDVYDTYEFGTILVLDGYLMVTEKDEFIYHEMITHPALAVNPDIQRVLLIGGGDGGAARELLRYDGITRIDLVEIDEKVVEVCREFLPQTASQLSDNRVHLRFEDGLKYVRTQKNAYDLIIVDSTDPFGPGEVLFTKEFYGNCFNALTDTGILINQHESAFYNTDRDIVARAHKKIQDLFPIATVYQAHIPTYPSGHWLFGFASKGLHPLANLDAAGWDAKGLATRYYNTFLHVGAFALPNYVKELLET